MALWCFPFLAVVDNVEIQFEIRTRRCLPSESFSAKGFAQRASSSLNHVTFCSPYFVSSRGQRKTVDQVTCWRRNRNKPLCVCWLIFVHALWEETAAGNLVCVSRTSKKIWSTCSGCVDFIHQEQWTVEQT